jgi:hypothetical protein
MFPTSKSSDPYGQVFLISWLAVIFRDRSEMFPDPPHIHSSRNNSVNGSLRTVLEYLWAFSLQEPLISLNVGCRALISISSPKMVDSAALSP